MSKSIPRDEKKRALQRSKRPNWQKLIDTEIDTNVTDPWDDGVTWPWSTDVGDVSWQTATKGFTTATYTLGTPGHSWQNVTFSKSSIGHKSLLFASKVIACSALDLMTKPELLKRAKQEFTERMKNSTYTSPISLDLKPPFNQLPPTKT